MKNAENKAKLAVLCVVILTLATANFPSILAKLQSASVQASEEEPLNENNPRETLRQIENSIRKLESEVLTLKCQLGDSQSQVASSTSVTKKIVLSKEEKEVIVSRLVGEGETSSIHRVKRAAVRNKHWEKQGLDTSKHPEIVMYRIQWFGGGWSPWYIPGKKDVDWKCNGTRRVWSYFEDHTHEYITIAK